MIVNAWTLCHPVVIRKVAGTRFHYVTRFFFLVQGHSELPCVFLWPASWWTEKFKAQVISLVPNLINMLTLGLSDRIRQQVPCSNFLFGEFCHSEAEIKYCSTSPLKKGPLYQWNIWVHSPNPNRFKGTTLIATYCWTSDYDYKVARNMKLLQRVWNRRRDGNWHERALVL